MTEYPILFNGDMVRAILDGRKTQTRRVIRPQPVISTSTKICGESADHGLMLARTVPLWLKPDEFVKKYSPYGGPSDRLWVRETHYLYGTWRWRWNEKLRYARWTFIRLKPRAVRYPDAPPDKICHVRVADGWFKRPSIFMSRKDARTFLEVVSIRVERVQDITPQDVIAEGIIEKEGDGLALRDRYENLWDTINLKRGFGWEANPWVFVVEFKREECRNEKA